MKSPKHLLWAMWYLLGAYGLGGEAVTTYHALIACGGDNAAAHALLIAVVLAACAGQCVVEAGRMWLVYRGKRPPRGKRWPITSAESQYYIDTGEFPDG